MKIWMINHYALPPDQQGGTRHFTLARALVEQGHEVTIFACPFLFQQFQFFRDDECREDMIDSVRFVWIKAPAYQGNGAKRVWNMMQFARHLTPAMQGQAERPDVIFASTPHLFAPYAAMRFARKHRIRFVLEVRDLWPQSFYDLNILPRWHPLCLGFEWMQHVLHSHADHIVTLLNNAGDYIGRHGGRSVPITVIPNMIDKTQMPEPAVETDYDRGQGPFTVLYAGAHGPANDLGSVLTLAAYLRDHHPDKDIRFQLIGSGPEKDRLVARALQDNLRAIEFRPAMPKAEIYEAMRVADIFIMQLLPSPVFQWGISPNKLFDYMGMGRPTLLCVDAPNTPIDLSDGGYVCPPGDVESTAQKLLTLYQMSGKERSAMGLRAHAYVQEHHDVTQATQKLERILKGA